MNTEHQHLECKALAKVQGKQADWKGLAKEAVAFANASGGVLLLGVEDDGGTPPPSQRIPSALVEEIHRRLTSLTVGVTCRFPERLVHPNGGEYVRVVVERSTGVASTPDGRYYVRVADAAKPVLPEDLGRLFQDREAGNWELRRTDVPLAAASPERVRSLENRLRASPRVSEHVREKPLDALLEHFALVDEARLTQLGVLWLGTTAQRRRLPNVPTLQLLRFDAGGEKAAPKMWLGEGGDLDPLEILLAVEQQPYWKEGIELPTGIFRAFLPTFDVEVVRELVANALAHRLYSMSGDVFVEVHPDRLEIQSPGPLPLGVTPANILHQRKRRNPHLTQLLNALSVMEAEGTGYDKVYRILLSAGKPAPVVQERDGWVFVTVQGRDLDPHAVRIVGRVVQRFAGSPDALKEAEIIGLGMVARYGPLSAEALRERLGLRDTASVDAWMLPLVERGVVVRTARTRLVRFDVSRALAQETRTRRQRSTLADIEEHRLRELLCTDVAKFPGSALGEIHQRIGLEVARRRVQNALYALVGEERLARTGQKRWARYWTSPPKEHSGA